MHIHIKQSQEYNFLKVWMNMMFMTKQAWLEQGWILSDARQVTPSLLLPFQYYLPVHFNVGQPLPNSALPGFLTSCCSTNTPSVLTCTLPPQLPLEPWACAALGSSLPHLPSLQPHPHLTRQWPQGRLPLRGAGAPQASCPSARSSPSVAKDGGTAGQDQDGRPASAPALSPGQPLPHRAPRGKAGRW